MAMQPTGNGIVIASAHAATSATSDQQLVASWVASLGSPHTRRNFERTGLAFMARLPMGLRHATVEDVRSALAVVCSGLSETTARQYVLRAKSLMTYAHELGYVPFNAGTTIKVKNQSNHGATLAKRIVEEVDVALLIRSAAGRNRLIIQVAYAGGLRVSEISGLNWDDVIERGELVQLNILGKGGVMRQVLLPESVSAALISVRQPSGPIFVARSGARLSARSIHDMIKRAAKRAGVNEKLSPHWLRHAHGSHAIDHGASLPEVQQTLGHSNVATTSGYLHARPRSSSGLKLDKVASGK